MRLFVYGTLKRGERNHNRFCRGFASAEKATVRGRLYDLPFGFPALVVPVQDVHTAGSDNYLADARLSHEAETSPTEDLSGWDVVHGELMTFDDPERRLPEIDGLEGFRPGEQGLYTRVLIAVTLPGGGKTVLAWAYSVEQGSGVRLPGGSWPA
ncbi:MAG: gamma-glutamylcyclotransferase [Actinomycetota bacterium]|nr:gamma-glutamylcyclotransferase [Actinomycetota bacterium]